MTYIIDPKLFYLAGICENLGGTLTVLGILGLIAFTIMTIMCIVEVMVDGDEDYRPWAKTGIIGLIIALCVIVLAQFIPDKETCYAMMVAKMTTVENVEFTIETLKSLVDYIAEVCAK